MKYHLLHRIATILFVVTCLAASAVRHDPYEGSRIFWDLSSQKVIFPSGNYARIIELQDGRLMAVAEAGGGISVAYSINGGATWGAPELIVRSASLIPYCVPDLVQLGDGTIIVGYNPRPSAPYSDDRRFGIRLVRSTDEGRTWSDPMFVYDARSTFSDGCWEPSFLELPDGELQCYFANENNFTQSNEQEISMCRSFDKGLTWSQAVRVCYRAGTRDGMPSAIITDGGEIVVIVEDNGWPGYNGFRATTVRCPLGENWSNWVPAVSDRRAMIFADAADKTTISAAPYLRKLATGETVASWQGDRGDRAGRGEAYFDMFVAVGNSNARDFRAVTQPFGLPLSQHALWNSVSVAGDGTVFALASIGDDSHGNAVNVMKGYAMKGFMASKGTPVINGSFSGEKWTCRNAAQVYMGVVTRNRATMDFLYDDESLYFFGRVIDRTIYTDKVDNDGIFLYLDLEDACDTYPQKGMYRLFMNTDGSVAVSAGGNNRWTAVDTPAGIYFKANVKSSYYDMEIAIPWAALGLEKAPAGKTLRCDIEVRDRRDGDVVTETIPDTQPRQSWTWPTLILEPAGDESGVDDVVADTSGLVSVDVGCGRVRVTSPGCDIASVAVYDATGMLVASGSAGGRESCLDIHCCNSLLLVNVSLDDGRSVTRKIIVK